MYYSYSLLIVKLIVGFAMIATYLFLSGKTQLTQQSPLDMIGNFIIGGAMGGTIYAGDSWDETRDYLMTLLLVLVVVWGVDHIVKRIGTLRKVSYGQTYVLINKGQFIMETFKQAEYKIDFATILSKLHAQGIMSFQELTYLQIEPDGSLVAIKESDIIPSAMVYTHDTINEENINASGASLEKIHQLVEHFKHENIVFIEFDQGHYNVMTHQQYHLHAVPLYGSRHCNKE